MATIVVQRQPKQQNNIWEQAAVNLIGGLITDAIQRGRETTQNRKTNLALDEIQNMLIPTTTNYMQGIGETPEGYNSNGWDKAFHKQYSPMEQFNMGTTDLIPSVTTSPQQTYVPTVGDFQRVMSTVLAKPRYSQLNREAFDKLSAPYLANIQENEARSRRQAVADAFSNAEDSQAAYNALFKGILSGNLPDSLSNSVQNYYTNNNLTAKEDAEYDQKNLDRELDKYKFDNLSAYQKMQNDHYYFGKAQDDEHFGKEMDYKYSKLEADQAANREKLISESNNNTRKLQQERVKMYLDALSDLDTTERYWARYYNFAKTPEEQQYAREQIEIIQNRRKNLQEQWKTSQAQSRPFPTSSDKTAPLSSQPKSTGNFNNMGSMFVGSNVAISKNGEYGNNRGNHNHGGTDYVVAGGTGVSLPPELGSNFHVSRVDPDPNSPTKYGVNVDVDGELSNGIKVRYRFAHLQEGSVNVRTGDKVNVGDIIAKTGNTGRVSGKNGGYHLHLEVFIKRPEDKEWGKVDPEKFFSEYINTGNNQSVTNNVPQNQPPEQQQSAMSQDVKAVIPGVTSSDIPSFVPVSADEQTIPDTVSDDDSSSQVQNPAVDNSDYIIWVDPKNSNNGIPASKYAELRRKVENGELASEGIYSIDDLDNYLTEQRGLRRTIPPIK